MSDNDYNKYIRILNMGFFRDLFYGTDENEEDYCFDETDFNRKNEYPEHEEYHYYDYNDGYEE